MEEFELKFLEVDVPELEKKLIKIGAKKEGEYSYQRVIMDYPNETLHKRHGWVRLRSDGRETTLTYKESIKDKDMNNIGMKEVEVIVDNYEKTLEIMKRIGLGVKVEERNRRIRYAKNDIVFDIDSWPQIPTYLEIESDSYEKAKEAARELDFDPEKGVIGTAGSVYKKYGINIDDYSSITFEKMVKK